MDSPAAADAQTDAPTAADPTAADPTSADAVVEPSAPAEAAPGVPPLPNIADYWPDLPQRLGPQADHYELPGVDATRTGPAWQTTTGEPPAGARDAGAGDAGAGTNRLTVEIPAGVRPRRPRWKSAAMTAALLGVAGAAAWVIVKPGVNPPPQPTFADRVASPEPSGALPANPANPPVSINTSPPATSAPPPSVPGAATFELADGSTEVNVTIGAVSDGWFRVTTPEGSGVTPRAEVAEGTLRVLIVPDGTKGSARVDVVLSEDVDWAVRMRGGFRTATLDLSRGSVSRIDLLGGTNRLTLALPRQDDAIPILMSGGVKNWRITTQERVPVRASFERGAGTVTLYDDRNRGVRRESELTSGSGPGGIELNAEAGIGTLTVSKR
ncbi:hypothetical protein [Actinoplanes sp. GCM10030250]|uniref:hypothetical protein n=1 Tax=Actinoplanes sp. GCM10030250 TaxID=3273376 RepID=UPI00361D6ACF